jgi:hypothetical protein
LKRNTAPAASALISASHAYGFVNSRTCPFFDSSNTIIRGKVKALEAWREFFRLFPVYRNIFESVEIHDNLAVITGYSTCSDKRLDGPLSGQPE